MEARTATILDYFEQINAIPRCSKNEARLARWLSDWAAARHLERSGDDAGNLVVRVPASAGMERAPTVVLQGHMDMVCEKTPDATHDFNRDPIRSKTEGDWLVADRTTLGADNGIALAYAMALAEDRTIRRPPMELLFTVDEETGLTGVKDMAPDLIGGKVLINLDSEDEGVFTIGCAGGQNTLLSMDLALEQVPSGYSLNHVVVGGLSGGHSGIDIDKQRGNAIKILTRTLTRVQQQLALRLVTLNGGTRHNAIARDAEALIACKAGDGRAVMQAVAQAEKIMRQEYAGVDAGLFIKVGPPAAPAPEALSRESTRRVLALLMALPHGVAGMAPTLEGLVETSGNLATAAVKDGRMHILTSQRSARLSRLEEMTAAIHALAGLAGAGVRDENHYPPWQPDHDAPLLKTAQRVYAGLYGAQPRLQVIHAGLECAIIGDRCPGMQMISFGPTIQNPHSPTERLHIPSVGKVWRFLVALLEALGR
jgi:dipeptidase D